MKTNDIVATLDVHLKQLREMCEYMETLSMNMLFDDFAEEKIEDAQKNLHDAASDLSEIIGREYLNTTHYGFSCFRLTKMKGGAK